MKYFNITLILLVFSLPLAAQESTKPTMIFTPVQTARVAVSPDGRYVASAPDGTGLTALYNAKSGKLVRILEKSGLLQYAVTFSPDGRFVAGGTYPSVWETETGKLVFTNKKPGGKRVYDLSFSPNGKYFASVGCDAVVHIWETEKWKCIGTIPYTEGDCIHGVSFSPDSLHIAFGGIGTGTVSVHIHEIQSGELVKTIPVITDSPAGGIIFQIRYHPDGTRIITFGHDEIRIFDLGSGELLHTLVNSDYQKHWLKKVQYQMGRFAISPDGRYLATGMSATKVVCIFDLTDFSLIKKIPLESWHSLLIDIAFTSDGKRIITAGDVYQSKGKHALLMWDTGM